MWLERGLTMVLVTHDSSIARRAQRIGVMKNGRLGFKQSRQGQASRPARVQSARTGSAGSTGAQKAPPPAPGLISDVPSPDVQAGPARVSDRTDLEPPDLARLESPGLEADDLEADDLEADDLEADDLEADDLSDLEADDSEPADTISFD
jgi:ABC-type multidrug transport system ATPase subunit